MRVELVEVVLEHGLRVGHLEDGEGDAVLGLVLAVEEVGLHPRRVLGILDEEVVKVGVVAHALLDHRPVPEKNRSFKNRFL